MLFEMKHSTSSSNDGKILQVLYNLSYTHSQHLRVKPFWIWPTEAHKAQGTITDEQLEYIKLEQEGKSIPRKEIHTMIRVVVPGKPTKEYLKRHLSIIGIDAFGNVQTIGMTDVDYWNLPHIEWFSVPAEFRQEQDQDTGQILLKQYGKGTVKKSRN